jgi:hypothetical protein
MGPELILYKSKNIKVKFENERLSRKTTWGYGMSKITGTTEYFNKI